MQHNDDDDDDDEASPWENTVELELNKGSNNVKELVHFLVIVITIHYNEDYDEENEYEEEPRIKSDDAENDVQPGWWWWYKWWYK